MATEEILLIVDESYKAKLCSVCVVCVQGLENIKLLEDQIRKITIDPVVKAYNKSRIFHYSEDSIGARQSLVPWISKMPISVYLGISQTNFYRSKKEKDTFTYGHIFPKILLPIVKKYQKRLGTNIEFSILFENLSDKLQRDKNFFTKIVHQTLGGVKIKINVTTKESEPLIFLTDYFLGYVRDHLLGKKPPHFIDGLLVRLHLRPEVNKNWSTNSLKLLSSKIGLICLLNNDRCFWYERGKEIADFLS